MKPSLLFIFFSFLSSFTLSATNNPSDLFNQALDLNLHKDAQWLRLIHFNSTKQRSNIVSEDFFLSEINPGNKQPNLPKNELRATINSLFSDGLSSLELSNQHPICKFPARYLWLKKSLSIATEIGIEKCSEMIKWSNLDSLSSISILLVSGYLGNPASTFGHVLMTLNTPEGKNNRGLLDTAINFGAAVPEGENSFSYIINGLFGGYQASFRENFYYADDLVYANSDQRDMWEYELELNQNQKMLLVAHIWELFNKKYEYYFLKQNCAYRIAELLELAFDKDILKPNQYWYAPVSLFNVLEASNPRQDKTTASLIDSITFRPSPERVLYANYNILSNSNKKRIQTWLADKSTLSNILTKENREVDEWLAQLDFLLEYNTFQTSYLNDERAAHFDEDRKILLQTRLREPVLSITEKPNSTFSPLTSPARGSAPTRLKIQQRHYKDYNSLDISFSPFYYDVLGEHAQRGSELILFNTRLQWNEESDSISIKEINLLQVQKIDLITPRPFKEYKYSWRIAANLINSFSSCQSCLKFQLIGGLGQVLLSSKSTISLAMLDFSYSDNSEKYVLTPHFDYMYSKGKNAFHLNFAYHYSLANKKSRTGIEFEYRYRLAKNIHLSLDYEHTKLSISETIAKENFYYEDNVMSAAIAFYY